VSAAEPMGAVRRRAIPGMAKPPSAPELDLSANVSEAVLPAETERRRRTRTSKAEQRAADYGATRLVNFRLPVDLHDRFRALVREAEERHPRLRKPSLTEILIALLEEAPQTADEVADLIRRKRLAEHGEG
jgi:hypothetical protein